MKLYRITFDNNKAISAQPSEFLCCKPVEIELADYMRKIKAMTIFASSEAEGIDFANNIVAGFRSFLLRWVA